MTYYRNVLTVEVLSDRPIPDGTHLRDVAYEVDEGDFSGQVLCTVVNEVVSEERMRELLIAQGSDPEFLIHDEDTE